MKLGAFSLVAAFTFVLFFVLGHTALAATGIWVGKYTVSCNVTGYCTLCDGLMIAANVVDLLTKAALAVAGAMVAYGGFRLMTSGGSDSVYKEGKQIIVGALIGLGITLFSWIIVNTLLSLLSNGSVNLTNPITCTPPPQPYVPALGGSSLSSPTGEIATPTGYTYDPGIASQLSDASPALSSLLNCMQSKLPTAAKRISSISDSQTIRRCIDNYSRPPCAHAQYSCHYGGSRCRSQYKSYGVDFGNEQYGGDIRNAAIACNAELGLASPGAFVLFEGDHIHVSVGQVSGCGCN